MAESIPCEYCENDIPLLSNICPHCGRPGLFPNVRSAENDRERAALETRYQAAKSLLSGSGATHSLDDFETAVSGSKAVIARSVIELQRLAESDNEIYATYYQLTEAEIRLPRGDKWDFLRSVTDVALFSDQHKKHIRFAALSLDGNGLFNYGECSIVMRENMIAHRASVFEENSALFMEHHKILMSEADNLPKGYRATWRDRAKLCVAKLYKRIDATTQPDEYSALLLRQGATSEGDEFVEVHIYGPITARTIEQVIISPRIKRRPRDTIIKSVKEKLEKVGANVS
jgi:hypothetical protein